MMQMDEKKRAEFTKELYSLCEQMRIQSKLYLTKNHLSGQPYNPSRLMESIRQSGGYETVRKLISSPSFPDGFKILASQDLLDVTLESFVLNSDWAQYFSDEELEMARVHLSCFEKK